MHNYPALHQEEPLTLNTYYVKVNQNRVFARSFFVFALSWAIMIEQ